MDFSLQTGPILSTRFEGTVCHNQSNTYDLQSVYFILPSHKWFLPFAAIVAFILLFLTFAVGLRCFADFDRGLHSSKVNGQYAPVATKMEIMSGD